MYRISESRISESDIFISSTDLPISRYPWRIDLFPQGKSWNIDAQNVPIQSFSFSLAEKGCMDAKIKFATIDFPVYYGNEISIYYQGEKRYMGYISTLPDPTGDTINISPYSKRLDEIRFNTTWVDKTFLEMLEDTIVSHTTETGIYYNPSMVISYNTTQVYGTTGKSIQYKYEKISKLIDDYYDKVDDIYWGVQENSFLYLKKRNANIDYYLYGGSNQSFQELKPKKDYAKIKETRYDVFQKSTITNESEYIATIPDGSSNYPYSNNEAVVGVKYNNLTAPQGLNSTECKDYAFAKITAQQAPENTKIKGLDIRRYDLRIGQRIKVYSETERQLYDLVSCDSTTKWWGDVSIDNNDFLEGSGSIVFGSSAMVYYDFGEVQHWLNIEKIIFMIKAESIGSLSAFSFGTNYSGYGLGLYGIGLYGMSTTVIEEIFATTQIEKLSIPTVNNWCLIQLPVTRDFRYLGFVSDSTNYSSIHIDDIKLYGYFNKAYEGNVIKLSYDINPENEYLYDVEIGDEDQKANDLLFEMQKKIDLLESQNQE
jgi:hypothetical protein